MAEIKIIGKNIEITDAMKECIVDKLSFLDKFLGDTDRTSVTISSRKTKFKITVVVKLYGKVVKIEREVNDFYDGLEIVVDKLKNTITRQHNYKVKQMHERIQEPMDTEEEIENPLIEIYKTVNCMEMTEKEAVETMESAGYDFYLFKNSEKESHYCVLYRRYDGTYGILEDTN